MKKVLFVDDEYGRYLVLKGNNPDADITWVQTPQAARECLSHNTYDIIMLDHDLGFVVDEDGYNTVFNIRPLIRWLASAAGLLESLKPAKYISHTANVPGGEWTVESLKSAGLDAEYSFACWASINLEKV